MFLDALPKAAAVLKGAYLHPPPLPPLASHYLRKCPESASLLSPKNKQGKRLGDSPICKVLAFQACRPQANSQKPHEDVQGSWLLLRLQALRRDGRIRPQPSLRGELQARENLKGDSVPDPKLSSGLHTQMEEKNEEGKEEGGEERGREGKGEEKVKKK